MAGRYNDARGAALVVVLLMMGLLTLLGTTYLTIASTEHTIASNEANTARAFNIAEAGLERAKARIRNGTEPLNNYLSGTPGPTLGLSNVSFAGGTYSVVVSDDPDGGVPPETMDTNNRVIITSTGRFNNNTVQKQLVALVEVVRGTPVPPVPAARGAAESLSGTGSTQLAGNPASFDGRNWTPHNLTTMASCTTISASDNTCGTLPDPNSAVTYGGFSNKSAAWELSLGGTMYGTGCTSGCTSVGTASKQTDTSVPHTRWDALITAAIAAADRTVLSSAVGGPAGTLNWYGPGGAPEITVINNSGTPAFIPWTKTVNGAGILIINSTSMETGTTSFTGQLNWHGLVIFRAPGEIQFDTGTSGKVRIFGQLVITAGSVAGQIELHNSAATGSFVRYSSAAMNMVPQAFGSPPSFTVRNWQEVTQ